MPPSQPAASSGPTPEAQLRRVFRMRWLLYAILATDNAMVQFQRVAPAVMAGDLMSSFGTSGTLLGALAAVYYYTYGGVQVPTGLLADSLGPRRVITGGILISAFGTFLFGIAPDVVVAFIGRALAGLGLGFVFTSSMKVYAEWFRPAEFATMIGLTMTSAGLGGVLATTPLSLLVDLVGWQASMQALAAVACALALLTWLIVRDRPEDLGLPRIRTDVAPPPAAGQRPSIWRGLSIVARNKYTWPAFFTFLGYFGGLFTFTGLWGIPYLMQVYGLSRTSASTYILWISLGLIIGGPLVGLTADRWLRRRKPPYVCCAAGMTAIWAIIYFVNAGKPPLAWMEPLCISFGLLSSAALLTHSLTTEVNPQPFAGIATGTGNAAGFLGAAIMQMVIGFVLDRNWSGVEVGGVRVYSQEAYRAAFFWPMVVMAFSTVMAMLTKETRCRNIYHELHGEPEAST